MDRAVVLVKWPTLASMAAKDGDLQVFQSRRADSNR